MNMTPHALLTNELEFPVNVEGPPCFSWWLDGDGHDQTQSAYQLIVMNDIDGSAVWDSGKTASAAQSFVRYAGPALAAGHPYSWKLRIWDGNDAASEYSEAARFATGLGENDWQARWLQLNDPPRKRSFYWYARTQRLFENNKKPLRESALFLTVRRRPRNSIQRNSIRI